MAKNYKYIVAANGTYHLFNNEKQASYCGRVRPGQEAVKLTSVLPKGKALEGLKTCARDVQLATNLDYSVTNVVRDVPGVGKVATVTSKPVQKATSAPEAVKTTATKGRGRKTTQTASQTVPLVDSDTVVTLTVPDSATPDDEAIYAPVIDFLLYNGISAVVQRDKAGSHLIFDASGYAYAVWAPEWNANGPAEGWVIQYNDDPASKDPGYAEPMLATESDVIEWLAEDLGLEIPKPKPVKRTAKKTSTTKADDDKAAKAKASHDTAKRLVSSHLVTIMSNAQAAREYADQYGVFAETLTDQLGELFDMADKLRKTI